MRFHTLSDMVYFASFMAILLPINPKGTVHVKILYHQNFGASELVTEDLAPLNLKESIEKTRQALEIAYSGFDNAVEIDLIDSYIYEINALQKRYEHLTALAAARGVEKKVKSNQHSPIRALVSHVFG